MEIKLGRFNTLKVVKEVSFGLYLDGGEEGEIEERLVATTQTPLAQVDEFAFLEVAWVNQFGAFLNWGLMKDLFVPFREQKSKMEVGRRYVVHVHLDEESFRIMASAKVEHYLSKEKPTYQPGDPVSLLVWQKTDLGFKVIVDNRYSGLLYENELFRPLQIGQRVAGYVKQVREDGKIDLTLQKTGRAHVEDFATILLEYIRTNGGHTHLNDKSPADEIYGLFGISKKTFKKAVGDLYKKRLITVDEDGLTLVR